MPLFRLLYVLICLLYVISLPTFAALEVKVSVDRNPVIMNESFNLIITANEDLPNWAFDSSPLLKDFVVGPTSSEKSQSIIQGVSTQVTRWRVRLTAQSPGRFIIPSFTIQGYTTSSLEVEVINATTSASGEQRPYFIQAQLSNEQPYVRQQLVYKIELYLQSNTALDSGTIQPPEAENTDISMLTQNRERQEIINGQRYRVITQEYALTPQRSGPLHIKGAVFNGVSRSNRGRMGFGRPEQVTLLTPDIQLEVKPKPGNFPGNWFISEEVAIEDTWDTERTTFPVGEPITRTITLTAAGVAAESLPELPLNWPASLRVYPERPQLTNAIKDGLHLAQARYSIVIIPSQSGTVTLPEVKLPWFNSRTESIEYAVLPERELNVIAPPAGLSSPQALSLDVEPPSTIKRATAGAPPLHTQAKKNTAWLITLLVVVSLFWLLTLFGLLVAVLKLRRISASGNEIANQVPAHARDALNQLKRACDKNNNKQALQALCLWQKARHGAHSQLSNLKQEFAEDTNLFQQVALLESSLYGQVKAPWKNGKQLWTAVAHLHSRKKQTSSPTLSSLYPH